MALEVRPTLQNMIVFQVVIVGLLGGIAFLSLRNPEKYHYSPIYNDHHAEYGGKAMACRDCHSEPFQAVPNPSCANSACHPRYVPEYQGFRTAAIYDANWTSIAPAALREAREENASLLYHHAPLIAGLNCRDCHKSHTPPPDGKPIHYDHAAHSYGETRCTDCHQASQAPPIVAHAALLDGSSSADCFACHQSGESWTKSVEWAGRPADATFEDGLRLIADRSVSYRSIAAAGPFSPSAESETPFPEMVAAPTPAAVAATPAPTPEPTPEATPPMFITPTPAPTQAASSTTLDEEAPFSELPLSTTVATTPEPALGATPAETPWTFVAPTPVPVDDGNPFTLEPGSPTPAATPEPLPEPTAAPTPRPAYVWDTFWNRYDPAKGLNAVDGKPVVVYFSHPGVSASRRFEIYAAEMQSVMAEIDGRMHPILVDMSKNKEVADGYGIVAAPTLARFGEYGTLKDKRLFGSFPTEAEILEYLRSP